MRPLLVALVLSGCTTKSADSDEKGERLLTTSQLDGLIVKRLTRSEFREIDCVRFYGEGMDRGGTRCFVSKLTRDEVLGELSVVIEPHVVSMGWGDDYGQYHGSFIPKGGTDMEFGLATSFLQPKVAEFQDAPDLVRAYKSDVIYTPPLLKGPS